MVTSFLNNERNESSSIKSKATRSSIQNAIDMAIGAVKKYKKFPEDGLLIFTGIVNDGNEHKKIMEIVEPPAKVTHFDYICDKKFFTDLLNVPNKQSKYGFVVIHGETTHIALLDGGIKILQKISVRLPKKHRKGGQSAPRFQRMRLNEIEEYVIKICNHINKEFDDIDYLIICGNGNIKDKVYNSDKLSVVMRERLTSKPLSISYGGTQGINELISKNNHMFSELDYMKEREVLNEYFTKLATQPNIVCYSKDITLEQLENGTVETLLISEKMKYELIDDYNINVHIISMETPEGVQFGNSFGMGGILRYEIDTLWSCD